MQLTYSEVATNLKFIKVSTMPLELRAKIRVASDTESEDGAFVGSAIQSFRAIACEQEEWRLHTANQIIIIYDLKMSKISGDKVT